MLQRSRTAATGLLTALTLLCVVPTGVSAQILWDAPVLIGPGGVSLFLVSPAGGDLGALATIRPSDGPGGVGYRFALAEENRTGDLAASGGVDVSGYLARGMDGSDVDAFWWSGFGLGVGEELAASIPLGIVLGGSISGEGVVLSPYGGAHVALDFVSGPGDAVDLSGAVDLGLDMHFTSGWAVRFGASLGDREALAVGVKLGG